MNLTVIHLYIIKNEDTMMKGVVDWGVNFRQILMWLACYDCNIIIKKNAIFELSLAVIMITMATYFSTPQTQPTYQKLWNALKALKHRAHCEKIF